MTKRKTGKIDLSVTGEHSLFSSDHRIKVVVKGEGDRDLTFPDDLAQRVIKKIRRRKGGIKPNTKADPKGGEQSLLFRSGGNSLWDIVRPEVPEIQDADFQALVNGADAIQRRMISRQFDGIMEQLFGDIEDTAAWAVANLDASLKQPLEDHQRQVGKLRAQVEQALPQVVRELARRNPGVPPAVIIKHAVEMLAKELGPIVGVLSVYSSAFAQYRSGKFTRQLRAINRYMESCYRLWLNGDVEGVSDSAKQQIPTSSLTVGMRLLSMIGGPGLGTIPGAKGPVGLSLLMYPLDMLDWIGLSLTLNSHEGGHQIFADIKGFEDEIRQVVRKSIVGNPSLKLASRLSAVGGQGVPTRDLVTKMATDCLGEILADVAGVLVNGPAFLYGMLLSFPAMLIRDGSVKDAKHLLRTGSVYLMEEQEDGRTKLVFEPHPPDYIRAYMVAAMVEEIGYKADAAKLRKLAAQAVGGDLDVITWEDASGKNSEVISIAAADVKAIAPIVAKALIREKLTSLGGKSLSELVLWNERRQQKALALKDLLLAGKSDLPKDAGSMYPTLIGSAAALAYWDAVHSEDANTVLPRLEETVLKMLEALAASK